MIAHRHNDQREPSSSKYFNSTFVRMEANCPLNKKKPSKLLFPVPQIISSYCLRTILITTYIYLKNTHFLKTYTTTVSYNGSMIQLFFNCTYTFSYFLINPFKQDLRISHFRTIMKFPSSYDMPVFLLCCLF